MTKRNVWTTPAKPRTDAERRAAAQGIHLRDPEQGLRISDERRAAIRAHQDEADQAVADWISE